MTFLIALGLLGGVAYKLFSPEERLPALRAVAGAVRQLNEARLEARGEPFRRALRSRTRRALATQALAAVNIGVFVGMLLGAGPLSDPATIIGWGGSFGPRTTNGEWWRLVAATFVNPGGLQLAINVAAILQVGLTLERLVGTSAFTVIYFSAGTFAGLAGLSSTPIAVTAGAAGAVFGLYGSLIGCGVWTWWRRSDVTIPIAALVRFAPLATIFLLYNLVEAGMAVGFAGLTAGLLSGLVVAHDVPERKPPTRRVGIALAAASAIAIVAAFSLRGITDVEPELQRLAQIEQRTADTYKARSAVYAKGNMPARELADLIERSIMPELQAADAQIAALRGVPRDDEWRIAVARQYLQLRLESWRLRVNGLRDAGVPPDPSKVPGSTKTFRAWTEERHLARLRAFGKAEGTERESLEVLNRLAGNTIAVRAG